MVRFYNRLVELIVAETTFFIFLTIQGRRTNNLQYMAHHHSVLQQIFIHILLCVFFALYTCPLDYLPMQSLSECYTLSVKNQFFKHLCFILGYLKVATWYTAMFELQNISTALRFEVLQKKHATSQFFFHCKVFFT